MPVWLFIFFSVFSLLFVFLNLFRLLLSFLHFFYTNAFIIYFSILQFAILPVGSNMFEDFISKNNEPRKSIEMAKYSEQNSY